MKRVLGAFALCLASVAAQAAPPTYSLTEIGTLGGTYSYGQALNAAGQVTGYAYTAGDAEAHAFLSSGGSMTDLGTLTLKHRAAVAA
jgi:probable HAF family extracellular repeat protein